MTIFADSISSLSLSITILVILGMTAAFGILFWLYSVNKKKVIQLGGEDYKMLSSLNKEFQQYKDKKGKESLEEFLTYKSKKEKNYKILMDVISWTFICFLLGLGICSIVFRSNGQQFYFGNTTYLTIQTGSMSQKNIAHTYYEELPDSQIPQYALIKIKKVEESDLEKFDIVAFKVDGIIYVHRIVQIIEVNGKRAYTTQGDANSGSLSFEVGMKFENILGRYTGTRNLGLGMFFTYLQSNTGIIAIIFAMLLLGIIDFCEIYLYPVYKGRIQFLITKLDLGEEENE